VAYEFTRKMDGTYGYSVIYSFLGGSDGYWPNGELAIGPDGSLYGTTLWGGKSCPLEPVAGRGCGTVFRLTPSADPGQPWNETILHRFQNGPDGMSPNGPLIYDSNRAIYGTAIDVVFRITP
jgi:hypothetical protein